MIELVDLTKHYPSKTGDTFTALQDINLAIEKTQIFGVIGRSGAGKSTLIRTVNLLERPTHGKVYVNGKELTALDKKALRSSRRYIGMIFQHFNLLSTRTVFQNIALPLELEGHNKSAIEKKVTGLLELVQLSDKKFAYPADLSGGQKQRVAIARALACDPKVLLCDEATSALDPQTTRSILNLLKDINLQLKLTILLITHEMDVIKQICDRVALLEQGKIIEQTEVFNFFTHPTNDLAKKFVMSAAKQELPGKLKEKLLTKQLANTHAIMRIVFHGKAASEPMIAHLMQEFGVKLNILQANIEYLKGIPVGIMIVEAMNAPEKLTLGIQYLKGKHVDVEIIGYVHHDVI